MHALGVGAIEKRQQRVSIQDLFFLVLVEPFAFFTSLYEQVKQRQTHNNNSTLVSSIGDTSSCMTSQWLVRQLTYSLSLERVNYSDVSKESVERGYIMPAR